MLLVNTRTGDIVIEKLFVRATFWGRFRGLLLKRSMIAGSGMLFIDTRRVHTIGMFFPLDLYFFCSSLCFIGSDFHVMPFTIPRSPKGTQHILEVKHSGHNMELPLHLGDQLSILWDLP